MRVITPVCELMFAKHTRAHAGTVETRDKGPVNMSAGLGMSPFFFFSWKSLWHMFRGSWAFL